MGLQVRLSTVVARTRHTNTHHQICVLTTHTFTDLNTFTDSVLMHTHANTHTLFTDVAQHREVVEARGSSWSTRLIEFSRQSGVAVIRSRKTKENQRL